MSKVSVCVVCHVRWPWEPEDHPAMCRNRVYNEAWTIEVDESRVKVWTEEEKKPSPLRIKGCGSQGDFS